ncbi:hypothetical protein [Candidatus Thermokryptus mobilis]|nr:hypothetical protein [Candidatus Thermokryptus mobilis]
MKGSKKYITILPYSEFKKMERMVLRGMKVDKRKYDVRFKEELLVDLLSCFKGDVAKMAGFIERVNLLRDEPYPNGCEKLEGEIYKILIDDLFLFYRVDEKLRLITVVLVEVAG